MTKRLFIGLDRGSLSCKTKKIIVKQCRAFFLKDSEELSNDPPPDIPSQSDDEDEETEVVSALISCCNHAL